MVQVKYQYIPVRDGSIPLEPGMYAAMITYDRAEEPAPRADAAVYH